MEVLNSCIHFLLHSRDLLVQDCTGSWAVRRCILDTNSLMLYKKILNYGISVWETHYSIQKPETDQNSFKIYSKILSSHCYRKVLLLGGPECRRKTYFPLPVWLCKEKIRKAHWIPVRLQRLQLKLVSAEGQGYWCCGSPNLISPWKLSIYT